MAVSSFDHWTCDDCGKETVTHYNPNPFHMKVPKGWSFKFTKVETNHKLTCPACVIYHERYANSIRETVPTGSPIPRIDIPHGTLRPNEDRN